uniref:DNA 3'-5' helicase n=1 Tax=viral metagenome TaxID=1070528 RepID=A0A6C0IZ22_9ZZZZ
MDKKQAKIIRKKWTVSMGVSGIFGSGKTTILLYRIRHLMRKYKISSEEIRILVPLKSIRTTIDEMAESLTPDIHINSSTFDNFSRWVILNSEIPDSVVINMDFTYRLVQYLKANKTPEIQPGELHPIFGEVKHIFVDEFQDINIQHITLLIELYKLGMTIMFVGDSQQSIYGFRGGSPNNFTIIKNETEKLKKPIKWYVLKTTYRPTREIMDFVTPIYDTITADLIKQGMIKSTKAKIKTVNGSAVTPIDKHFRNYWVCGKYVLRKIRQYWKYGKKNICILSRFSSNNILINVIKKYLLKYDIPVTYNGTLIEKPIIFDEDTTDEMMSDITSGVIESDSVEISSIHSAKGKQWDIVFLIDVNDGTLPLESKGGIVDISEDTRLFYVGITRAVNALYILHNDFTPRGHIGKLTKPSRFLYNIPVDMYSGDLPEYKDDMYAKMSSIDKDQTAYMATTKIIGTLGTKDFDDIIGKYPSEIERTQIHKPYSYPYDIIEFGYQTLYGQFIECLIIKTYATKARKQIRVYQIDQILRSIPAKHKLEYEQISDMGSAIIEQLKATKDKIKKKHLKKAFNKIHIELSDDLLEHLILIVNIYGKLDAYPMYADYPNGLKIAIHGSYEKFLDVKIKPEKCYNDILRVASGIACHGEGYSAKMNLSGIKELLKTKTKSHNKLVKNIRKHFLPRYKNFMFHITEKYENEKGDILVGEMDLIVDRTIIDIKTSVSQLYTDNWWMQLMSYYAIMINAKKSKKKKYDKIVVYNPVGGYIDQMDLAEWDDSESYILKLMAIGKDRLKI